MGGRDRSRSVKLSSNSLASEFNIRKKKSGKNEKTTRAYDEQENMRNEKNEEKARQSLHDGI